MKRWILLAVLLTAVGLLTGSVLLCTTQKPPTINSPSCNALGIGWGSVNHENGLTYLCGTKTVTDGRLSMTLNNYEYANGNTLDWECPTINSNGTDCSTSGVLLLANITIANIGKGNTSLGPNVYVNVTNGAKFVGNGELGANALFPGKYPNQSVPATNGGTFLAPGKSLTYWFVFWLPSTATTDIPSLKLNNLSFVETVYGGDWEGGGQFGCIPVSCQNPLVDLILVT
jgi:hypothetical protein